MVAQLFWGRVPITLATAMLHSKKGSKAQNIMHKIKYKNRPELGLYFGEWFGSTLQHHPSILSADVIIPVPIHTKKLLIRGYNQSEKIAEGLSIQLQKPLLSHVLVKSIHTESQTRKTREERIGNVQNAFIIHNPQDIEGKHVILTDDTITTGATLEVCAQTLLQAGAKEVSVLGLAYAR